MRYPGVLGLAHRSPLLARSLSRRPCFVFTKRKYATHREIGETSFPLSQSLDTRQRTIPRSDTVGPFQLGLAQSSLKKGERVQKWSELSTGGKIMRTTARTTNLAVILLGAGLFALLGYSLSTELFSKNSPTVLYGDACERIKASAKVAKYLHGPLSFHNSPPSAIRPRHRDRHVISQIMVDAHGQEHMIMTFYVHGQPPGSNVVPSADASSYFETTVEWTKLKVVQASELTLDESIEWSKEHARIMWDKTRRLFKYLAGTPLPPPPLPVQQEKTPEPNKTEESNTWSFAGMFSTLRGSKGTSSRAESKRTPDGQVFTEGEVHANFVRNNDGYFVFRYLLIDFPNSRERNPTRIFVERAPGVRDNEPVMRWNSSY
ncbi:histone H3.2 [Termitomyces sp. T112]|nr:histone H3.2 [Termitomyces sp. T112]KAH0590350.1 hypothetical protein H2248_000507 [Termitomyces sp. 'cryptogamus']